MKIKKIVLILITVVYIFALFSFATSAKTVSSSSRIQDYDNYIPSTEESRLEEKLKAAEEECGVPFRVYVYEYSIGEGNVDMYDYERIVGESFDDLVHCFFSFVSFAHHCAYTWLGSRAQVF